MLRCAGRSPIFTLMITLAIAYTNEDQPTARRIATGVESKVHFEHFTVGRSNEGTILADLLTSYSGRVILLVSDNFLTNPNCMLRAESIFSADREILPVVIDAHRFDEVEDRVVTIKTSLATRSDRMHYVSHWQDRYIELRRSAEALTEAGGESFENYLRKIRETSTQVEDILKALKDTWSLTDVQFSADHYRQLFLFAEREDLWRELSQERVSQEEAELPEDLSAIPGMEFLETSSTAQEETVAESTPPEEKPAEPEEVPPAAKEAAAVPEQPEPEQPEPESATEPTEPDIEEPPVEVVLLPEDQAANWIRRAWTMSDAGNTADGLELLNLGRENFPEQLDLHYQYALMLALAANDVEGARHEVDALLKKEPDYQDALYLSGELWEASGNHIAARDDWERLVDLEPFYPYLNQRLGLLLVENFSDDYLDAAGYLRRAVKDEQASPEAFYQYALLLSGPLDREKKAIKMLRRAVKKDPEHAPAQYELAVALFNAGRIEQARTAFRLATALESTYDTAANRRAFFESPPPKTNEAEALRALKQNVAELEAMLTAKDRLPAAPPDAEKTIVISGATSGIGLATAERLAANGYRLILIGRRAERLESLADELREDDVEVHTLELDVRDRNGIGVAIRNLPEEWRRIDVLINNAGKAKGFDPIHEGNIDHWEEMIDVNLKGLLYLTRAITPAMVERGTGMVINVASTAGKEVYPNGNVYCATKHAVDALTYSMRLDLVHHGIRVGQICPAHVEETEFALVRFDGDRERARIYNDFQPLRASDVAKTIHFMIDQPAHVNILDVVLQGTQQASSTVIDRSGRDKYHPEEE